MFFCGFKRVKFVRFINEERTEIVGKYLSGKYEYKALAKKYGITCKIVESMVRKYKKIGTTIAEPKGRKPLCCY